MKPDALLPDCHQWHKFWLPTAIGQQAAAQLVHQPVLPILSIPWGHNLAILTKRKRHEVQQETVTMKTSAIEFSEFKRQKGASC